MRWQDRYKGKLITAEEAAKLVKSGDRVAFAILSDPEDMGMALARRKDELGNVTLASIWQYDYPWLHPGFEDSFRVKESFIMTPGRQAIRERRNDWVPLIYGLSNGVRQAEPNRSSVYHFPDVFFVKLSPPNRNGYCSFGHAVWLSPTVIPTAKTVVAEIDPSTIWTYGESVHVSELDYLVEAPPPKAEPEGVIPAVPEDELRLAKEIGRHIASLIRDGDCIEIGLGTATEAVIPFLRSKNDLGIYTEVIFREVIELVQAGVVTGKHKNIEPGRVTCTMLFLYPGDARNRACLDFVSENPTFQFHDVSWICNIPRMAANDNLVSINNLIGIDLCGQAVATHLGPTPYTGYGGGMEFTIGPHYSRGGRVIHALMSTAKKGSVSRIVPQHEPGTVVSYPAVYMDYLVTEHGVANLSGKSRREMADAIISVADPKFHSQLRAAAKRMFYP